MSVFTPFRSKSALTTALVVGGALKVVPTWVTGHDVLHAQNQQVDIARIGGQPIIPAVCDSSTGVLSTIISAVSTQTQVVIGAGSSFSIYACGWHFLGPAGSTFTMKWVEGTSTDCVTGAANKSGLQAYSSYGGIAISNGGGVQFKTSSGTNLCINTTSTGVGGLLTYKHST